MWSLRMRASKIENNKEKHISGAEGIYSLTEAEKVLKNFLKRALEHPKGSPDKIVLTVERIKEPIQKINTLPLKTVLCKSPDEAHEVVKKYLGELGISEKALLSAWKVIKNYKMRGAALIDSLSGHRLEPDKERGVRVSRIQMDKKRRIQIFKKIGKLSTEPQRVIEALTVASKVASCPEIIAELCVSDNPDYTTGYIASKLLGYLRITNIKNEGQDIGGRAFFVKTPSDIEKLIKFLEKTPVIVI
uniref:6-carboxyhexanoate--CoA ligase n=1 Tax=Thermodesulfovibrio aggregans TaxID=86166 RepID=A0A7C4AJJ8_9BACT